MYRLKPILETASRIHSANGGVRASQARDDEAEAFADSACVSGAMLGQMWILEDRRRYLTLRQYRQINLSLLPVSCLGGTKVR